MTEIGHSEEPAPSAGDVVTEKAARISRRKVLAGVVGLAGLVSVLGRDKGKTETPSQPIETKSDGYNPHIVRVEEYDGGQTFSLRPEDFSADEDSSVPLPDHVAQHLKGTIDKINPILSPNKKIHNLEVRKRKPPQLDSEGGSNLEIYYNAVPDESPHTINYSFIPDREYSYSEIKLLTSHEMMHLFGPYTEIYSDGVINDFYNKVVEKSASVFDYEPHHPEQRKSLQLDKTGLLAIFDESSYVDTATGWQLGHPDQKKEEFFASSLNIMLSFPRSLVATIETLRPEDKKEVVAYFGYLIKKGPELSADSETFNKLLSTHFVNYIEKEKINT